MTDLRFIWRGVLKAWWLPAVSNPAAPTRAEITAGTDLTPSLYGISGFSAEADINALPSLLSDYVAEDVGVRRSKGNALAFYDALAGTSVRSTLAENTAAYVVLVPYGDSTGRRCEVWPSKVATLAPMWEDVARFRALLASTAAPSRNAVLPA